MQRDGLIPPRPLRAPFPSAEVFIATLFFQLGPGCVAALAGSSGTVRARCWWLWLCCVAGQEWEQCSRGWHLEPSSAVPFTALSHQGTKIRGIDLSEAAPALGAFAREGKCKFWCRRNPTRSTFLLSEAPKLGYSHQGPWVSSEQKDSRFLWLETETENSHQCAWVWCGK